MSNSSSSEAAASSVINLQKIVRDKPTKNQSAKMLTLTAKQRIEKAT